MKKLCITMALAGALSTPTLQAAFDGAINISGSAGQYGGGPFTVDVTAGLSTVVGGNGLSGAAGTGYRAFCLEFNEHITLPNNYDANLNTEAVLGSGGPHPDPVSRATAWLYSQFRAGTLAANALGYTDTTAGNNALQQAIWWLEQETDGVFANNVVSPVAGSEISFNNFLVAAAVTATGAGTAANARTINANGEWGVMALNLYTGDTTPFNQDMLAIVPEPTTIIAGALLLLPFGASTIRFIRRKPLA